MIVQERARRVAIVGTGGIAAVHAMEARSSVSAARVFQHQFGCAADLYASTFTGKSVLRSELQACGLFALRMGGGRAPRPALLEEGVR